MTQVDTFAKLALEGGGSALTHCFGRLDSLQTHLSSVSGTAPMDLVKEIIQALRTLGVPQQEAALRSG